MSVDIKNKWIMKKIMFFVALLVIVMTSMTSCCCGLYTSPYYVGSIRQAKMELQRAQNEEWAARQRLNKARQRVENEIYWMNHY